MSKDALYHPSDLMRLKDAGICVIEHSGQYAPGIGITYDIRYKGALLRGMIEENLTPITFSEFLFYTDPATGGLKIGKNKAWPLLIALAIASYGIGVAIVSLIREPEVWMGVQLAICLGVYAFAIIGTYRNWKGKQT